MITMMTITMTTFLPSPRKGWGMMRKLRRSSSHFTDSLKHLRLTEEERAVSCSVQCAVCSVQCAV